MTIKNFDCVEMKRQGAAQVRERLAGMTLAQETEYWRVRSEKFMHEQEAFRAQAATRKVAPTPKQ